MIFIYSQSWSSIGDRCEFSLAELEVICENYVLRLGLPYWAKISWIYWLSHAWYDKCLIVVDVAVFVDNAVVQIIASLFEIPVIWLMIVPNLTLCS